MGINLCRGFESLLLRLRKPAARDGQPPQRGRGTLVPARRGGRAVECGGLENRYGSLGSSRVQIPPSPLNSRKPASRAGFRLASRASRARKRASPPEALLLALPAGKQRGRPFLCSLAPLTLERGASEPLDTCRRASACDVLREVDRGLESLANRDRKLGARERNDRSGRPGCGEHRVVRRIAEDDRLEPGNELPRLADRVHRPRCPSGRSAAGPDAARGPRRAHLRRSCASRPR